MSHPEHTSYLTVVDYLTSEESADYRREYVDGQIYAMTGTTRRHNIIAGNLCGLLRAQVKGGPCRVYMSDVKVRVEATNSFYYPDVMVACDTFNSKSVFTSSPKLIIEVLSQSTASIDRREKVTAYRQIATLREYIIVSQNKRHVQIYRKDAAELWNVSEYIPGDEILVTAISDQTLSLTFDEIYADSDGGEPESEIRKVRESTLDTVGDDYDY